MSEYKVTLDEREQAVLLEAAQAKDMSPEAVIRHWFRMGQLVNHLQTEGDAEQKMLVRRLFDSLSPGPKKAPVDYSRLKKLCEDMSNDGRSGLTFPPGVEFRASTAPCVEFYSTPVSFVRSCNRHDDCDKAEVEVAARRGITRAEIHASFHCHDDECEDCFGS